MTSLVCARWARLNNRPGRENILLAKPAEATDNFCASLKEEGDREQSYGLFLGLSTDCDLHRLEEQVLYTTLIDVQAGHDPEALLSTLALAE